LRDGEGQGGFSGPGGTDEKKGTPRKFTRLDKVHNDATGLGEDPDDWFSSRTGWARDQPYLSGVGLADKASGIGSGVTVLGETETFYVGVDGYAR